MAGSAGIELSLNGDKLTVKCASKPPDSLVEAIKADRDNIVTILKREAEEPTGPAPDKSLLPPAAPMLDAYTSVPAPRPGGRVRPEDEFGGGLPRLNAELRKARASSVPSLPMQAAACLERGTDYLQAFWGARTNRGFGPVAPDALSGRTCEIPAVVDGRRAYRTGRANPPELPAFLLQRLNRRLAGPADQPPRRRRTHASQPWGRADARTRGRRYDGGAGSGRAVMPRFTRFSLEAQKILDDLEEERMRESLWRRDEALAALKRFSAMRGRPSRPWQSLEARMVR